MSDTNNIEKDAQKIIDKDARREKRLIAAKKKALNDALYKEAETLKNKSGTSKEDITILDKYLKGGYKHGKTPSEYLRINRAKLSDSKDILEYEKEVISRFNILRYEYSVIDGEYKHDLAVKFNKVIRGNTQNKIAFPFADEVSGTSALAAAKKAITTEKKQAQETK